MGCANLRVHLMTWLLLISTLCSGCGCAPIPSGFGSTLQRMSSSLWQYHYDHGMLPYDARGQDYALYLCANQSWESIWYENQGYSMGHERRYPRKPYDLDKERGRVTNSRFVYSNPPPETVAQARPEFVLLASLPSADPEGRTYLVSSTNVIYLIRAELADHTVIDSIVGRDMRDVAEQWPVTMIDLMIREPLCPTIGEEAWENMTEFMVIPYGDGCETIDVKKEAPSDPGMFMFKRYLRQDGTLYDLSDRFFVIKDRGLVFSNGGVDGCLLVFDAKKNEIVFLSREVPSILQWYESNGSYLFTEFEEYPRDSYCEAKRDVVYVYDFDSNRIIKKDIDIAEIPDAKMVESARRWRCHELPPSFWQMMRERADAQKK